MKKKMVSLWQMKLCFQKFPKKEETYPVKPEKYF